MSEGATLSGLLFSNAHLTFLPKPPAIKNMFFKNERKEKKKSRSLRNHIIGTPSGSNKAGAFVCKRICRFWPKVQIPGNSRCVFLPEALVSGSGSAAAAAGTV